MGISNETINENFRKAWGKTIASLGPYHKFITRPWTVSVAAYPGDKPCAALEALDRVLAKRREWRDEEALIDAWKAQIEWAPEPVFPFFYVTPPALDMAFAEWEDWLVKRMYATVFQIRPEDIEAGRVLSAEELKVARSKKPVT